MMKADEESRRPVRHLALFLTECCNLRCDYCFAATMNGSNASRESISTAIDRLFELSGDEKGVSINFWGGEPFLRLDELKEAVALAEKKADSLGKTIGFSIPTNATLLSRHVLEYCKEHRISLSLSIDGDKDSQSVRKLANGQSSHALVSRRLPLIREILGRDVQIRMTVAPHKVDNLMGDVMYFLSNGFRRVRFYPASDGDWTPERIAAYRTQLERLGRWYEEQVRTGDHEEFPRFGAWDSIFRRLAMRRSIDDPARRPTRNHCGAGDTMVAVAVNGDVFPCHRFVFYDRDGQHYRAGNVHEGCSSWPRLDELADVDPQLAHSGERACSECAINDLCTYFCAAHNFNATGDLYGVEPAICRLMEVQVEVLEAVYERVEAIPFFRHYLKYHAAQRNRTLGDRLVRSMFEGTWERTVDSVVADVESALSGERGA